MEVTPPSSARDDEHDVHVELTANQQFRADAAAVAAETAAKLEAANVAKKDDLAMIEKKVRRQTRVRLLLPYMCAHPSSPSPLSLSLLPPSRSPSFSLRRCAASA